MYFLSGRRNLTRTLYAVFDRPVADRAEALSALLIRDRVRVVVINCRPEFSRPVDTRTLRMFESAYPHGCVLSARRRLGRPREPRFVVRWKDDASVAGSGTGVTRAESKAES